MPLHAGDQQPAHAGDAVQALDVDGAHHRVQKGRGDVLDQRDHGVAEDVPQGDAVLAGALGPGQQDIVLVALVHHVAAQPHGVKGDVAQAHREHRQDPVPQVIGVEQKAHVQGGGAVHLDIQIVDRRRHRLDQDDDGRADLVGQPVLEPAHHQPQGDAQNQGHHHGRHAHLDGDGQLVGEDVHHRHVDPVDVADPEIALEGVAPEPEDLHGQRVQQAHGLQAGLDLGLGHFFVVGKVAFHRHQPEQAEHERHDDEQRQDRMPDPLGQIFYHIRRPFFIKTGGRSCCKGGPLS